MTIPVASKRGRRKTFRPILDHWAPILRIDAAHVSLLIQIFPTLTEQHRKTIQFLVAQY